MQLMGGGGADLARRGRMTYWLLGYKITLNSFDLQRGQIQLKIQNGMFWQLNLFLLYCDTFSLFQTNVKLWIYNLNFW